jgi:hypothetical protein
MKVYKIMRPDYYGRGYDNYYFNTEDNARKALERDDYLYEVELKVCESGFIEVAKETSLVNIANLEYRVERAIEEVEKSKRRVEEAKAMKVRSESGEVRKAKEVARAMKCLKEDEAKLEKAREELAKA